MNIFQSINASVLTAVVVAMVVGAKDYFGGQIAKGIFQLLYANIEVMLFISYLIVTKLKITFDDHKYFESDDFKSSPFKAAHFLLAATSWMFWIFAGYFSHIPTYAAGFLGVSFIVSTLWVILHAVESAWRIEPKITRNTVERAFQDAVRSLRQQWVLINVIFIAVLLSYNYGLDRILLNGSPNFLGMPVAVLVLIGVLLYDIFISKPFDNLKL